MLICLPCPLESPEPPKHPRWLLLDLHSEHMLLLHLVKVPRAGRLNSLSDVVPRNTTEPEPCARMRMACESDRDV